MCRRSIEIDKFQYPKKVACPKNCPKINGYIITRITTLLKGLLGYDSTGVRGPPYRAILGVGKLPYISRIRTAYISQDSSNFWHIPEFFGEKSLFPCFFRCTNGKASPLKK